MSFETRSRRSYESGTILQPLTAAVAAAAASLAIFASTQSEGYSEKGVVHLGANGREYVLPKGAERPVYASLGACVTDVTAQLQKIEKATGEKAKETPQQLCQPVAEYQGPGRVVYYPGGYYYGPIVNPGSIWRSPNVKTWQVTIPDGTFAAPGEPIQSSLHVAGRGLHDGEPTTLTNPDEGGFGEHSSGGFTEDGGHIGDVHVGGGGGEEPHISVHVGE